MAQHIGTSTEAAVREMFHKIFEEKNLNAADHYINEDVRIALFHKWLSSREEWKELLGGLMQAVPDVHYELNDFVCEGNRVAFRFEAQGTHQGDFWGVTASGKPLAWNGLAIFEFEGGKIQHGWIYSSFHEALGSASL